MRSKYLLILVSDLFIGRHLICFFPKHLSKSVMTIPTASLGVGFCMFLQACLFVSFSGPATACLLGVKGLSVRALGLVL